MKLLTKILTYRHTKYLAFGLVMALMPTLASMGYLRNATIIVLGSVLFYAVVAIGLSVLLGYAGLVSLGTAGFMGLAAYLSAYMTGTLEVPFLLSLVISVLVPVLIGVLVGLVSLRVSGMYLAIATLAVAEIFIRLFGELSQLTGGFSGMRASFPSFFGRTLDRGETFSFIVVVLVAVMILTDNVLRSATGRALLTMRASEPAAAAMGINLLKYKLLAFALATGYAALAGVLYVHFIQFAFPSDWNLLLALQLLAVIVIGGLKSIMGTVLGAFVVFGVPTLWLSRLPIIGDINGLSFIFTGVLIIVVILFYPQGLSHVGRDVIKGYQRLRKQANRQEAHHGSTHRE